jgi:PKD repeat protein
VSVTQVLVNTLVDKITPNLPPTVAPVASPATGVEPLNVSFSANALDADGEIVGITWNFDDGTTSTLANPTHLFQCDGAYEVTVQATDDQGAAVTGTVTVTTTSAGGPLTYGCDVQLTFNQYCAACHGGSGGLTLNSCAGLQAGGMSGAEVIPGSKESSRLWTRINEGVMPPTGGRLPQADIDRIGQWIDSLDPADTNFCD